MNNRNIHINPKFYSHPQSKIHINPSFVKKVNSFSERGIDTGLTEEDLNKVIKIQAVNASATENLTVCTTTTNQLNSCNEQNATTDSFNLYVNQPREFQYTHFHNQLNNNPNITKYAVNNSLKPYNLNVIRGPLSKFKFENPNIEGSSSKILATKSTYFLRNSVNDKVRSTKLQSDTSHFRNEGLKKSWSLHNGANINTHIVPTDCSKQQVNSYFLDNNPITNLRNEKSSNHSNFNKNIIPAQNFVLNKSENLKLNDVKNVSHHLSSPKDSQPTIFKSRSKLIRKDTLRKSAKFIKEDLFAKKRKYAVKTKTKLVRRNSINSKCKKYMTPKLSKLRRSLTLRKGTLLRAKEKIVFNQTSKPKFNVFSKNNKFIRKGSIMISKFKIYKYMNSKSKLSSHPASNKYFWHHMKRGSRKKSDKFINISGSLYKSTATSLKKQDLSPKPKKMNKPISSKRACKRYSLNSPKNSKLIYKRQNSNLKLESGTLIEIVRRKKLANFKKVNDFCFFYNKYGKCKKENNGCPFIHDPNRIAICTRFLQGSCSKTDCTFSHKLDKNKMPVCSHFLEGLCSREDCPYRHVFVNPGAPLCINFLKGHCPEGEECKNKHIFICEDFNLNGKCPRGNKCLLSHRKAPLGEASKKSKNISSDEEKKKKIHISKIGVLGLSNIEENKKDHKNGGKGAVINNRYFDCRDDEEDKKDETIFNEKESPYANSEVNLKRKRILEKLDKIKRNYNYVGDVSQSLTNALIDLKRENSTQENNCSLDFSKIKPSSEPKEHCSYRLTPLPEVLPSFIPLVMPEDCETK